MLTRWIPSLNWILNYKRSDFSGDLSAGIIVAVMLIPQGMAYAQLAGLPPVIGLYASTIPLLVYALFGTSRHLSVGPVALVSLLVFTGVSTLAEPGTEEYFSFVLLLMLMIGAFQFLMGVLRLGVIVNFLSHAVISGFTSAAAIIIGLSQFNHLFGVTFQSDHVLFMMIEAITRLHEINFVAFAIGVGSISLLIAIKKYTPKVPGALVVVGLSILLVYTFQLQSFGLNIVGEVPQGLPRRTLPLVSVESLLSLLPMALTISLIGFMESIAMAKAIAEKEKYKVLPNKELVGLGLANVVGSFFSAYPVTGGFSRSAVNYQAGARTPLASIITAILILFTLAFFTKFFYYLPSTVLAAIIIVAVYQLIDVKRAKELFAIRRSDGWIWVITFIATLTIGITEGIMIGFAFSIVIFIFRSASPHIAELGYLQDQHIFRNINCYPDAIVYPHISIFRVDASLYFANMTFLEDELCERIESQPDTKWVILDFSGVNSVDAIAVKSLEQMMETCKEGKIKFLFASIKGPVMDVLKKAGWNDKYGNEWSYLSINHALQAVENKHLT